MHKPKRYNTYSGAVFSFTQKLRAEKLGLRPIPRRTTSGNGKEVYYFTEWRDEEGRLYFYTNKEKGVMLRPAYANEQYLSIWREFNW